MQLYILILALVAVAYAGMPPYYYRQYNRMPYQMYRRPYQYMRRMPYGYMQNGGNVAVGVGVGGGRGGVGVGVGVGSGRGRGRGGVGVGVGVGGVGGGVGVGVGVGGGGGGYMYPQTYYGGQGGYGMGGGMPYVNSGSTISIIGYPQASYGGMGMGMGMGMRQPMMYGGFYGGGGGGGFPRFMMGGGDDMFDRPKPLSAGKSRISSIPVAASPVPGSQATSASSKAGVAPAPHFFRYGVWKSVA